MLSKPQLETMALRWAKAYRPALLPELHQQGPQAAAQWAQQKAVQVIEDFYATTEWMETAGLPLPEIEMRRRSAWEMVLADHFPATSEEQDRRLPPKIQAQLEAIRQKDMAKWTAEGPDQLSQEEAEELWDRVKESQTEFLLEIAEDERIDRGAAE